MLHSLNKICAGPNRSTHFTLRLLLREAKVLLHAMTHRTFILTSLAETDLLLNWKIFLWGNYSTFGPFIWKEVTRIASDKKDL